MPRSIPCGRRTTLPAGVHVKSSVVGNPDAIRGNCAQESKAIKRVRTGARVVIDRHDRVRALAAHKQPRAICTERICRRGLLCLDITRDTAAVFCSDGDTGNRAYGNGQGGNDRVVEQRVAPTREPSAFETFQTSM